MPLPQTLPSKITKVTVCSDDDELGLLTHGSVHNYQPTQDKRHVSLTITYLTTLKVLMRSPFMMVYITQ